LFLIESLAGRYRDPVLILSTYHTHWFGLVCSSTIRGKIRTGSRKRPAKHSTLPNQFSNILWLFLIQSLAGRYRDPVLISSTNRTESPLNQHFLQISASFEVNSPAPHGVLDRRIVHFALGIADDNYTFLIPLHPVGDY